MDFLKFFHKTSFNEDSLMKKLQTLCYFRYQYTDTDVQTSVYHFNSVVEKQTEKIEKVEQMMKNMILDEKGNIAGIT